MMKFLELTAKLMSDETKKPKFKSWKTRKKKEEKSKKTKYLLKTGWPTVLLKYNLLNLQV